MRIQIVTTSFDLSQHHVEKMIIYNVRSVLFFFFLHEIPFIQPLNLIVRCWGSFVFGLHSWSTDLQYVISLLEHAPLEKLDSGWNRTA